MHAPSSPSTTPSLLVACLCAQWCGSCRDYRAVFDALAANGPAGARFRWIDIEDEARLMGAVDVEDFPTLLIVRDGAVCFFGPVTPHAATARALVDRAAHGALLDPAAGRGAAVAALAARLEAER